MRREWLDAETDWSAATSWTARRLIGVGGLTAVAAFVVGIALAQIMTPGPGPGPAPVAAADPVAPPEVAIGDAVTATRRGPFTPAPVEDLVVVRVSVSVCGTRSMGSGVVVAEGLLLTAAHVVGDARLVRVDHGGATVTGEVLGVLADGRDVALVAVDAAGIESLTPVSAPPPGHPITLVGYPDGERRSVSVGPRVELADAVTALVAPDAIGVDAAATMGFSGGPALDRAGAVIGIVVANETATGTALVVPLGDLDRIGEAAVVPGGCPTDA